MRIAIRPSGCLQPGGFPQFERLVDALPGELGKFAPEVTVVGGEVVNGAAQIEVADDRAGAQVKVLVHQGGDLIFGDDAGAEGLNVHRDGARHADGVSHLDLAACGQSCGDHVLRSPARGVSGGAVHLRGVLPGESAAAMAAHPAVGIDDDLAPGDARVAHRSADDEAPGGVDVDLHPLIAQAFGDDRVDDVLQDARVDIRVLDRVGVLGAHKDGIDAHRLAVGVLNRHLALAVGAQPWQDAGFAHLRKAQRELMRQVDGHGHQYGSFVAGVAEHHPLVAGADGLELFFGDLAALRLERFVDAERDIGRLGGNGGENAAGVAVEALLGAVVADTADHLAHELVKVDEGGGGDLAEDHHVAGLGGGFARHARARVLLEAGVKDGVADQVAKLIGVTFGDRLGSEFEAGTIHERGC